MTVIIDFGAERCNLLPSLVLGVPGNSWSGDWPPTQRIHPTNDNLKQFETANCRETLASKHCVTAPSVRRETNGLVWATFGCSQGCVNPGNGQVLDPVRRLRPGQQRICAYLTTARDKGNSQTLSDSLGKACVL